MLLENTLKHWLVQYRIIGVGDKRAQRTLPTLFLHLQVWNLSQECPEPGMNLVTQPGIQHCFLKLLVLNSVTKNTVLQVKTLRCNLNFYCREHAEGHMQPKGCLYTGVLVLLTSSSLSGCASPANHKQLFLSPAALFQPPLVALGRHPVQVHKMPLPWAPRRQKSQQQTESFERGKSELSVLLQQVRQLYLVDISWVFFRGEGVKGGAVCSTDSYAKRSKSDE